MIEAIFELFLQVEALEEHLKNQQTGEGSELLILETDHRNFVEFCMNL